MIQEILQFIIISLICIIWGTPVFIYFNKKRIEKYWISNGFSNYIFLFFSGLLLINFISSWFVLIAPLKFEYLFESTFFLSSILLLFYKKDIAILVKKKIIDIQGNYLVIIFLSACVLLFIILGSIKPVNIDTQLYHLQIIRWSTEYGTVPGIANLYPRLGTGSNWFNLISIFQIQGFKNQNFTFLNVTITIWFLFWLLSKWYYYNQKKIILGRPFSLFFFFLILYFLYDWQLFRDTANSTSYDFIVTALTIIVLTYIAEDLLLKKTKSYSIILISISIMIIPFKLSGIFILIPLFFYLLKFKTARTWIKTLATSILILSPLLLRNYFISGYPLFPSTFKVNSPDWQLPYAMAKNYGDYIQNVNKYYNYNLGFIFSFEKTTFNWIPFWFNGILQKHKFLLLLSSLSIPFFFYHIFATQKSNKIWVLIFSLWLMTAFWFFTAPDPRFAFGFLLFLAFFPLAVLFGKFSFYKRFYNVVFIIITPIILVYAFIKGKPIISNPNYLIHVESNNTPPYKKLDINNSNYYYSEKINNNWNNRCFYTPLPCICEENPYIIRRGESIKKGFQMKPITDSNFIKNYNY